MVGYSHMLCFPLLSLVYSSHISSLLLNFPLSSPLQLCSLLLLNSPPPLLLSSLFSHHNQPHSPPIFSNFFSSSSAHNFFVKG